MSLHPFPTSWLCEANFQNANRRRGNGVVWTKCLVIRCWWCRQLPNGKQFVATVGFPFVDAITMSEWVSEWESFISYVASCYQPFNVSSDRVWRSLAPAAPSSALKAPKPPRSSLKAFRFHDWLRLFLFLSNTVSSCYAILSFLYLVHNSERLVASSPCQSTPVWLYLAQITLATKCSYGVVLEPLHWRLLFPVIHQIRPIST